ncbi:MULTISPECIES: polysaccharide pyruvyl transferase family protein [Lactococcus]|uniref:polysaccharide pyruvyl transferase family protein n=1 Tax=Lactococcus TaxID=1357 RepID=UPI002435FFEE|nr:MULTISPECIES: polysaccharide pyruvyl transferase family protein [Lactococcus]MDG6137313.1 polysaccharide pyruvyl transferase family protein [Lactococcus petauri]MDT2852720.1 polysaccharide pyruvyl transferase family protein [Lactococcus lactis]
MEIGIITFHASYNCGSILQCLALETVLEQKNQTVSIINFSNEEQQKLYSVFYKKKNIKNIVKNILCLPGKNKISNHYNQYQKYIDYKFKLSGKPFKTSEELSENLQKFDMLIAGGDQVWNVKADDSDSAYFLDFATNTYKISYAPSLGATNINNVVNKERYKNLLNDFNDISCREVNGKKWLEELTGRDVKLLLDPTLLLNKEEWKNKIDSTIKLPFEEEYIFYYAFSYSSENNEMIQRIAEKNNLKVVVIDSKQWYIKRLHRYKNFVLSEQTGPNAFLNFIEKSKYVMTTSFHGTVFSLIFHKKFIYINGKNHEPTDDRTSFLLERLNLLNKYLYSENVNIDELNSTIDYNSIDSMINELKSESFKYLDDNIEKAKL